MDIKEINKLNKKGFTLIELLGVIVILAVISGIATYGVISVINTSKLKSEKIFIDKLSNLIDDYLDLYPPTELLSNEYTFEKCIDSNCASTYTVTAIQIANPYNSNNARKKLYDAVSISDLVNGGIVTYEELINPKNKKQCFSENFEYDPEIFVYKDTDYVYHYYVDLTNNACDLDNTLIDNMPEPLIKSICEKQEGICHLPDQLKEKYSIE